MLNIRLKRKSITSKELRCRPKILFKVHHDEFKLIRSLYLGLFKYFDDLDNVRLWLINFSLSNYLNEQKKVLINQGSDCGSSDEAVANSLKGHTFLLVICAKSFS